jgi:xylulokinase
VKLDDYFDNFTFILFIDNFDFSSVSAISASGQQHGSVYWKKNASSILKNLNPSIDLYSQLSENTFSVLNSPIWMDSSTSDICEEIEVFIITMYYYYY